VRPHVAYGFPVPREPKSFIWFRPSSFLIWNDYYDSADFSLLLFALNNEISFGHFIFCSMHPSKLLLHTSPLLTDWVIYALAVSPQGGYVLLLRLSAKNLAIFYCPFTTDFRSEIGSDFNELENKTTKHFSLLSTRLENVFTVAWLIYDY